MKVRSALLVIPSAIVALSLSTLTAAPAEAITWRTAKATTLPAYDHAGYRAYIKPSGYPIPSGSVDAGSFVTVKNSAGRTVATRVARYRGPAGVYTAFSTIKFRSKTAYTAYRSISTAVTSDDCTVTGATVTDTSQLTLDPYDNTWWGSYTVVYNLSCTGYDANYDTVPGTFQTTTTETEYTIDAADPSMVVPDYAVGEVLSWLSLSGTITRTVSYTAYRYGSVRTVYVKRGVTVKKRNTGFIARSEWNQLRSGQSMSTVAGILGQNGQRNATSGSLEQRVYINCFNDAGRYIGSTWSIYWSTRCSDWNLYYLIYRNGRLYSW